MTKLPQVSGQDCVKALERAGFQVVRQKSSHIHLKREGSSTLITIPDHKALKPGTLRTIIRNANLSVDEFVKLLK